MNERQTRYATSPDVVYTRLSDDEAVLLDMHSQRYFSINETGVTIWELLAEPRDLDEIAAALVGAYAVEWAEARAVAQGFVADLQHDGLIRAA